MFYDAFNDLEMIRPLDSGWELSGGRTVANSKCKNRPISRNEETDAIASMLGYSIDTATATGR